MRILLRQQDSGFYLQPSGQWSNDRKTAREFVDATAAYWWAVEQSLPAAEVLLAFTDTSEDFVSMSVKKGRADSRRSVVDCRHPDWHRELHSQLYAGAEVDLMHFDYHLHGQSCELIAQAFDSEFQLDRVPSVKAAHFRKKPERFKRPEATGQIG